MAFPIKTTKFANMLNQGLVELPKDSTKWNDAVACKKNGSILIILLYYHYLGTRESDVISLKSLITRIMLLPKSTPISVLILKPLWLLFAVSTYLSRTCLRYALITFDFAGNVSISSAS
ncbi:PREDICTED: uncharacterized protein LOC105150137 [Acromyrmex echinatior]|uniref:uncharacterized protein LOC105150137 n=1 Tax=Acromyrmex echinatior TaxID=103372 RepID=UPI000580E720|nr:PREDICTED: uncharacterized protein LOC105150137 [Acromyrmex echinatior]